MVEIRAVRTEDVPAVVELVTQTLTEFGLEFGKGSATDDSVRELPASYEAAGGAFWVAYDGEQLLGTCGVMALSPTMFELRKMYLRAAARGTGLGRRLLDVAVAWTRGRGGTHLVLDTAEQMTAAIRFYESHGFERDDRYITGARCSRGYVRRL